MTRHILAAALCFALAACGGGGGSDPSTQPQAAPARVVDVYGDSIALTEAQNVAPLVAPDKVRNHAVSGSSLQQAIVAGLMTDAAKSDAAAVVLAYGTNDALMRAGYYSPAEYRAALSDAARAILASGKGLVIETAPQVIVSIAPAGRYNNLGADQYARAAREVAREVGAVLCDRNTRQSTPDMMPDGVHPTGALAASNAQALAACIRLALHD
jgi:lysophospholipase L1-like esterase